MLEKLINKIYLWKKEELVKEIESKYKEQGNLIVNFIYYASLSKYLLHKENLEEDKYYKSLVNWDFLLPDGIALKLFLKYKYKKVMQENLNWTDFTPFLINYLQDKWYKIHLSYYTVYDENVGKPKSDFEKVRKYIEENFKVTKIEWFLSHYKDRGSNFDFERFEKSISDDNYDIKLFLVGIWSPFQEMWTYENKDFFKKNWVLIMDVWGLFDFWTNFEKRAPNWVLKLNWEWLWRLIQNPKKNWTKVKESFGLFKEIVKK